MLILVKRAPAQVWASFWIEDKGNYFGRDLCSYHGKAGAEGREKGERYWTSVCRLMVKKIKNAMLLIRI